MAISFTSKKSLQYAVFGAILGLYEIALLKGEIGMTKGEIAKNNFMQGYNCAQAVACTYCDLVGVSEEEAFRSTEAFGLGMGGMLGTCGALSGAVYSRASPRATATSRTRPPRRRATPSLASSSIDSPRRTVP